MEEKNHDFMVQNNIENSIDFIEIASVLWAKKKIIIRLTLIFLIIGILLSILTPNEYTATSTMIPQTGDKKNTGGLSGLAAIAGINIGSLASGEVLSPNVYPKILDNINFQKELIYSKFSVDGSTSPITLIEYINNSKYWKQKYFFISRSIQ